MSNYISAGLTNSFWETVPNEYKKQLTKQDPLELNLAAKPTEPDNKIVTVEEFLEAFKAGKHIQYRGGFDSYKTFDPTTASQTLSPKTIQKWLATYTFVVKEETTKIYALVKDGNEYFTRAWTSTFHLSAWLEEYGGVLAKLPQYVILKKGEVFF